MSASAAEASPAELRSEPSAAGPELHGDVTVSVVICAYTEQRWTRLLEAIGSARRQSPRPHQVIVVVDHNPTLQQRLAAAVPDDVLVLTNRYARGLSGARNTGVEASSGAVVAFLDDDARAEENWLRGHAAHYRSPEVLGVGGSVHPVWGDGQPHWFPREFAWVVGCTYAGLPEVVQDVRNPIGANMSFRRAPVLEAGGFREGLGRVGSVPLGCEETELALRLSEVAPGGRILHDPDAAVHHHVTAERAHPAYFRRRCWAEGLSKALVSRVSGAERALSAERSYLTRTVPSALARELRQAVRHRDRWALARSGAIVTGVAVTTSGYAVGRGRFAARSLRESFRRQRGR